MLGRKCKIGIYSALDGVFGCWILVFNPHEKDLLENRRNLTDDFWNQKIVFNQL
jgi:hypothetical protein